MLVAIGASLVAVAGVLGGGRIERVTVESEEHGTADTEAMAGWEAIRLVKTWCGGAGCVAVRPSASDRPGWIQVRVPGRIDAYDARVMASRAYDAARWEKASIDVLDGSGMVVAKCDGLGVRN